MSQSKFQQIAVGWMKEGKNGQYVSAVSGGKNQKNRLFVELEDGQFQQVSSFFMFFNQNKSKESHPDVQFVMASDQKPQEPQS